MNAENWLDHPDGRLERHGFDRIGRVHEIALEAPGVSHLAGAGPEAGTTPVTTAYRELHRVAALDGPVTHDVCGHDAGGCLSKMAIEAGGATPVRLRLRCDVMNRRRFTQIEGPGGGTALSDYDTDGRLLRQGLDRGFAAPGPVTTLADTEGRIAAAAAAAASADGAGLSHGPAGRRISVSRTAGGAMATSIHACAPPGNSLPSTEHPLQAMRRQPAGRPRSRASATIRSDGLRKPRGRAGR